MNKIEQLRLTGRLPTPKGVALAILEVCRHEDASRQEVSRLVQTDPALSGRLLRLANSAGYAGRAVVSIDEAILRLGLATVRQLAMGFSLVEQNCQGPCTGFDYPGFWSHSLLMAVASHELGSEVRLGSPDELFSCSLLAQIGQLALATAYPVQYADILESKLDGEALLELERERLALDHVELTAVILEDCGIPKALGEPVCHHETPEKSGFVEGSRPYELTYLFYLARRMADLGLTAEAERHGKLAELMRLGGKFGLDADALGEMFDRTVARWQEWGELFKVPVAALPTFESMTNAPAPRPEQKSASPDRRVLLVEDEPTTRMLTEGVLRQLLGCTVYTAENGKEALAVALETMPQIVITDWLMPVMDGFEFCRALRATEWGQSMYVIMLTGVEMEEKIVEAFEAGVDDYVTKPVNIRALNARMRAALHYVKLLENWKHDRIQLKQFATELAISNRRLEHTALTDLLTGLPNRRAGMSDLDKAWSVSRRTNQPVAALAIDIDYFKRINDRHGHAAGDLVLQEVARTIQAAIRKHDTVSRIGGEEFLVVCHDADPDAALQAAERLRKMVKALTIHFEGAAIQTSVSIGVASREETMQVADDMVRSADKALYAAKHAGRDRIFQFAQGKTVAFQ